MDQLNLISQKLMIIFGILMYIFGTIGNLLNIYVFSVWSRRRKSSKRYSNGYQPSNSSLYLLISSIGNLIVIVYPLLTRIIFDGFQYSVSKTNVFLLCKLRFYTLHTFDLVSLTCICLATFERYLLTSRKVQIRRLSPTRKRTKQMILTIICLFGLHSIPIGVYFDVSDQGRCVIISTRYLYYYLWTTQIFLRGIFPIVFLTLVCSLTFQQLKNLTKNKSKIREKQFSRMLLLISSAIVLSSIPYCIEHIHYVMIVNDRLKQSSSLTEFYHVISSILFYTNAVTSFYIFYISTPNFRLEIQKLIFCERTTVPVRILIIARNSR